MTKIGKAGKQEPFVWYWNQDPWGANETDFVFEDPNDKRYQPLYKEPKQAPSAAPDFSQDELRLLLEWYEQVPTQAYKHDKLLHFKISKMLAASPAQEGKL